MTDLEKLAQDTAAGIGTIFGNGFKRRELENILAARFEQARAAGRIEGLKEACNFIDARLHKSSADVWASLRARIQELEAENG